MFSINHVATASVLALTVDQPVVVMPVAFASHLALDALPHFGRYNKIKFGTPAWNQMAMVDLIFALCLCIIIGLARPEKFIVVLLAAFCAIFPDILWAVFGRFEHSWLGPFYRFHKWVQWGERPWGVLVEVGWLCAMTLGIARLIA